MDIIINICKTVVLFVWKGFDKLMIYFLFEVSNGFRFVLKELGKARVISSFPIWSPGNLTFFIFGNKVAMNIFEVIDICSILRNILKMAIDGMNGLTLI